MRKLRVPLSNFQFGEISPSLILRTDSKVYSNSAQKVENFLAKKGILVRGMKVYGLSNHLRVSIGTEDENIKFVNELKTFFNKQS